MKERLDPDTWTKYTKSRFAANALILAFRTTLEAFKNDPGQRQSINLDKIIGDIQYFAKSICGDINKTYDTTDGREAISRAIGSTAKSEEEIDQILLSKFKEIEERETKILNAISKLESGFKNTLIEMNSSQNNLILYPSQKRYTEPNQNCWREGLFRDQDIKSYYDARRTITDEIITSVQNARLGGTRNNQAVIMFGDSYSGKTLVLKRVIFELITKGYIVIFTDKLKETTSSEELSNLLQHIDQNYDRILLVVDNLHNEANQKILEVFNSIKLENIGFLFAARENELNKFRPEIEDLLKNIPPEAQHRLGFGEADALLFVEKAIEITYNGSRSVSPNDLEYGKKLYHDDSKKDPFMFNLGLRYDLSGEKVNPDDFVGNEMREITEPLGEEGATDQNKLVWKAALVCAVGSIFGTSFDLNSDVIDPETIKMLECTQAFPASIESLARKTALIKQDEFNPSVYKIRHEQLAYVFLNFLYCDRYRNSTSLFDQSHKITDIIGCFWKNVQSEKLIDALTTCATLYNNRHKQLSLLLTGDYISKPFESFRNEPIIDKEKLKKLYCYGFGDYYLNIAKYEESLIYYDKVLGIDQDYVDALLNKGFALSVLDKDHEVEMNCYDRAIGINPNLFKAWDNKSYLLYRTRKLDEAIIANKQAINIDPEYANAWYNRSIYFINKDNLEEGLSCLSKAIKLDNTDLEVVKTDKDFDRVRGNERFQSFMSQFE